MRFRLLLGSAFALILCGVSQLVAAQQVIHHPKGELPQDQYMIGLLKLGLSQYPDKYKLEEHREAITRSRLHELVKTGGMSVMWTGASKSLAESLQPVHIPAYKGLMGHRVFIIRKDDQARFDRVHSLDDLRNIALGQGRSWSDVAILENGGFDVITAVKSEGLFYMLDGGRFDAFPRGVQEPWLEISSRPQLDLTVEKNLVLKYVMPYYFFVAKDNQELARDLTDGLKAAIADGRFDRHFYADPEVKLALEKSNLKDRTIYTIDNINLPPGIPVDDESLWLNLSN